MRPPEQVAVKSGDRVRLVNMASEAKSPEVEPKSEGTA
jgi:hypothetical protein